MKTRNHLTFSTSPQTQPARNLRKTASLALRQRPLCGRPRRNNTGKELDSETGLYYYGARYLDPRISRWLSGDPAVGEYVPSAPVSDDARKRNGNLPGMGGVFNYANLHAYHYAGNNPVKLVDPDGEAVFYGHYSFQWILGYHDIYDRLAGLFTRIHGTRFNLGSFGNLTLRLWKGAYGFAGMAGEIGLYTEKGRSLNRNEIAALGIKSTTLQIFENNSGDLIGEKTERGSYWTTRYSWRQHKGGKARESLFTVNTFEFETNEQAQNFYNAVYEQIGRATDYFKNNGEQISVEPPEGNIVKIYYGGKPDE